jgi:hypothetical protein
MIAPWVACRCGIGSIPGQWRHSKKALGERTVIRRKKLEATIEPCDSLWKAPDNINKRRRNLGNFRREHLAAP